MVAETPKLLTVLVSIDKEKAFNRVNLLFLSKILDKTTMSERIKTFSHTLYVRPSTKSKINELATLLQALENELTRYVGILYFDISQMGYGYKLSNNEDKSSSIELARVTTRKSPQKNSNNGRLQEIVVPHKPLRTPRKQFSDTVRKTSHEGTPKKVARKYVKNDRLESPADDNVVPLKQQQHGRSQGTDNDNFRSSTRRYFKKVPSDDPPDEKAVNYSSSLDLRKLLRDNEKTASCTDTSKEGTRKRTVKDSRFRPSGEKGVGKGTSQPAKKPVIERKKISPPGFMGEHLKKLSPSKSSQEQTKKNIKKGLSDGDREGTWVSPSPPRGSKKQRGDSESTKQTTRRDKKKDANIGRSDEKVFPSCPVLETTKRRSYSVEYLRPDTSSAGKPDLRRKIIRAWIECAAGLETSACEVRQGKRTAARLPPALSSPLMNTEPRMGFLHSAQLVIY
ncbi:transcriptional regulator ATRX homolog [Pleurodeles waltl]|uniref:transcriptional regulator ATRX homolog n=1 Tax=Pleurodeles waltl TaxID=8319 RepID=UPI003709C2F6